MVLGKNKTCLSQQIRDSADVNRVARAPFANRDSREMKRPSPLIRKKICNACPLPGGCNPAADPPFRVKRLAAWRPRARSIRRALVDIDSRDDRCKITVAVTIAMHDDPDSSVLIVISPIGWPIFNRERILTDHRRSLIITLIVPTVTEHITRRLSIAVTSHS